MFNRRVGNTGSEPAMPMQRGAGAMGKPPMPQVMPARPGMKKGGSVKSKPMAKYASGGMVKADGCAMRGKTKGKEC